MGGLLKSFSDEIGLLIFVFVPLSIGVAILRYRLWDIDIIIPQDVGLFGADRAAARFTSAAWCGAATHPIDHGETSDVAIVISTLVIAALFFPLRRRVQTAMIAASMAQVDVAKTLAAFSATARDEVEFDKLTAS